MYETMGLGSIVIAAMVTEIVLIWMGHETSEAILAIASTATGALAGLAIPKADGE